MTAVVELYQTSGGHSLDDRASRVHVVEDLLLSVPDCRSSKFPEAQTICCL